MMDVITTLFTGVWDIIGEMKVVGIPVIYFFLMMVVLGVLVKFIKGKK